MQKSVGLLNTVLMFVCIVKITMFKITWIRPENNSLTKDSSLRWKFPDSAS